MRYIWSESSFSFLAQTYRLHGGETQKTRIQLLNKNVDGESLKRFLQQNTITKMRPQIALELFVALLIVAVPFSVQAGIFSGWLTEEDVAQSFVEETREGPADIELLSSTQNPNPTAQGGAEVVVDENALVSTGPVGADDVEKHGTNNGEISVYTVREGDSLSEVAEMFGVTANTIKWANDLAKGTDIQPGDTLVILPIAGVSHIVKSGDSISTIAKKYEGNIEEILAYNQLDSESDINVGDTLIIPGGAMHSTTVAVAKNAKPTKTAGGTSSGNASFIHPAPGSVKTQGIHGYNAVDLAGSTGSTIRAAAGGQVIVAKGGGAWNGGYGNYIVIKHNNGTQTLYAHLSSMSVASGEYVEQGQTIGGMGNTGKSTGTHLHFEVRGGKNPF